jgi:hypothetical protein
MEPLKRLQKPQISGQTTPISRRAMLTGMALAAFAPVACLGRHFAKKTETKPNLQGRLVATWQKTVTYADDSATGGSSYPGLLARVYLFGPLPAPPAAGQPGSVDPAKGVPYLGDGTLTIFIHDATPRGNGADPKLTDVVIFNPNDLAQFASTDFVGPGYTIFCPWFNYNPEVTHLFIQLLYKSPKGEEFFHQSGTMAIDHGETLERAKKGMPAYKRQTTH